MAFSVGSVSGITAKTGIGGLSSGMDIDSLILKMTAASRKRITQQEQTVQKLMWKQDAYRSVTQSMIEFRSKYLDNRSATNFKSVGLFNTIKATVAEGITAFSASATSDAGAGKVYVNQIQQLATNYVRSSNTSVSSPLESSGIAPTVPKLGDLATSYNNGVAGFMLDVDGQSRAVVFDSSFISSLGNNSLGNPNADTDLTAIGSTTEISEAYSALETSLQRRINQLFENPANIDSQGDVVTPLVKVSVDSTTGAINFSSDRASRIKVGYLSEPTPKTLNRSDYGSDQDYNNALEQEKADSVKFNTLTKIGFTKDQTNRLDATKSIDDLARALGGTLQTPGPGGSYQFFINDVYFDIKADESVNSLINKINSSKAGVTMSYSEVTDKFTMTSNTSGAGVGIQISEIASSVPGQPSTNLFEAIGLAGSAVSETFGTNSISFINGNYIERSSNDFIVDGVKFSLKELYNENTSFDPADPLAAKPSANSGEAVKLATNPDDLFNAVKQFVEDYNAMITNIRGMTKEKVYSDYEPLTDEQRGAMTESQVKLWEEKAKSGILANDNLLNNIASKLQNALLGASVDGYSMFNMGIESAGWSENGKLKLDEDKLKDALNNHPGEVQNMFLKATDGISAKLDKIIDDSVRTNGVKGTRGSLIEMAGYASTRSDLDNALKLQIESYTKRIDSFKDMLKKEESRLWNQFSAMETALSRLNEQSALLSQYLGTSTNSQ
ncbi:hypothetical protein FACS1894127_3650 [Clostridia bacterium]|nr:hypothetical protein FACS1894127_3650 [Clostridia bacterium]